jgi:hypothetical protein
MNHTYTHEEFVNADPKALFEKLLQEEKEEEEDKDCDSTYFLHTHYHYIDYTILHVHCSYSYRDTRTPLNVSPSVTCILPRLNLAIQPYGSLTHIEIVNTIIPCTYTISIQISKAYSGLPLIPSFLVYPP